MRQPLKEKYMIAIGSDHGGFALKEAVKKLILSKNIYLVML